MELYDLVKDPNETVNLMFDQNFASIGDDLLDEISGYMKTTGDRLALPKDLRINFLKLYKNGIQKSDKSQL